MAPMALFELTDLTADPRWAKAAIEGVAWSRGANELGSDCYDTEHSFALSIDQASTSMGPRAPRR